MFSSENVQGLFDTYGRQARLFPGLLTFFPILLAFLAWFPTLLLSSIGGVLLTLVTSCGLLYALGSWARTKGKRIEPGLLQSWGGWPTTLLLRHSSALDPSTRSRYHNYLRQNIPDIVMPTEDQEASSPVQADQVYDSAVRWLKEKTRGKMFPMIDRENAQYGFRRNLRGLRNFGLWGCVLTVAISLLIVALNTEGLLTAVKGLQGRKFFSGVVSVNPAIWAAMAVNVIAIVAWLRVVTNDWVREAADQYAIALLASCDRLSQSKPSELRPTKPRIRRVD